MVYWIRDIPYKLRMFCQKLFRPNHIPDNEIWNLDCYLVKLILPRLQAFKKAKRVSYQVVNKETYDYMLPNEEMDKKEAEAWEDVLDRMIFAFEFAYQEAFDNRKAKKLRKKIKEKFGDWDGETENNKHYFLWKKNDNGSYTSASFFEELSSEDILRYEKEDGKNWLKEQTFYYNVQLHSELQKKATEGFELFGKYFQGLWD